MFRQTPSGPTFTQTPLLLPLVPPPEPLLPDPAPVPLPPLPAARAGVRPDVPLHGGHAVEQVDRGPAALALGGGV